MKINEKSYWLSLCEIVAKQRCWLRIAWIDRDNINEGWWGQLLTIPTEGYLEAAGGPVPLTEIEWIEVSMNRIKGGLAGHPLQMVDIRDEIIALLEDSQLQWEILESTWSVVGVFDERPVEVARISRPVQV